MAENGPRPTEKNGQGGASEQAKGVDEPRDVSVETAAEALEHPPRIRDYFSWRPLPWWICFFLGIFLLTKLQLVYNDSPCAVLGTQSPVGMADVKRAFRSLSMCTHPDRLRGRLKREPTKAESRRGEIVFNRASSAKDELAKAFKSSKSKTIPCYQGELEMAIVEVVQQGGKLLTSLGVMDYVNLAWEIIWNLISFQNGFWNTLLSLLWFAFFFRLTKQFFLYLWRMGFLVFVISIVTTVVIGPIPTVVRFMCLPVIRLVAFVRDVTAGFRSEPAVEDQGDASPTSRADSPAKQSETTAPPAAVLKAREDLPQRNIRQRKKKETDEEKEKRNKDLLTGSEAPVMPTGETINHGAGLMPENSMWKCVNWSHQQPLKARQEAAQAVQFDLLLILTKPVIPLMFLICLGQVWNGLFSSLLIGHALRRWVPQMNYEAHHLLCALFGVLHTVLGVSAQQVEDYANRDGQKVLHLAWAWSFKDVLSVMHMCLLGSTVTACAALGNEPSYAASFAAGIAVRIAIAQDSVQGLNFMTEASNWLQGSMRDIGVTLDAAEEVVAYSGHGIGDCAGGPLRMLFGDTQWARLAGLVLKVWLGILPFLSTMQWLQRTFHAGRKIGKRRKMMRFIQRSILFLLGVVQCCLIVSVELNASNGTLGNFWVAMLFGCIGESLLSTYDIRGPVRQMVFLALFLFI